MCSNVCAPVKPAALYSRNDRPPAGAPGQSLRSPHRKTALAAAFVAVHKELMPIPVWLPILLGTLTAVGPLSIDMYLPAFPAMETAFGTPGKAPVTVATFFVGLAVGQMTQGPLADRLGRRTPLIWGMSLYTAASVGCALAPDLWTLSGLRMAAAFGGSAGMVVPRAIVRDLAAGAAGARLMSRLILVMGAAPILAPSLGGAVLGIASWRTIFWILAGYGLVSTLLVWRFLPETLPVERRRITGLRGIARDYLSVAADRRFLAPALASGLGLAGLFAYIAASPAVFIGGYGMSPGAYAAMFGMNAAGFILASQLNAWMLRRVSLDRALRGGVLGLLSAALLLLAVAIAHPANGWWLMPPLMLCLAALGFTVPNAAAEALQHQGARAGSASALMGTLQFLLGALFGAAAAVAAHGSPVPLAALILAGALGSLAAEKWRRA